MPQTIPIEVSDEALQIIQEFASRQGMNAAALLSSVAESYAEWYIPVKSFDPVTVPKKMLGSLFEMISKESTDKLAEQCATESRNIVLLSGSDFSVETAIAFTYKVSKYFMGADAKLIKRSKDKEDDNIISFIIRHDGGDKFSYFCARCFYHFFTFFPLKHVIVDHDPSSVHIKVDLVEDEVESMKRYLESIEDDIKKIKSRQ
jgi:hypothetical protein